MDPRYTGYGDPTFEANDCVDPDVVKEMEIEEQAIWLGKWFGHHYAAWVSGFNMKELETYETNMANAMKRDMLVDPVPSLWWTFHRFWIPEDEWRSPLFHPPVQYYSLLELRFPSRPLSFGLALGVSAMKLYQPFVHTPFAYLA